MEETDAGRVIQREEKRSAPQPKTQNIYKIGKGSGSYLDGSSAKAVKSENVPRGDHLGQHHEVSPPLLSSRTSVDDKNPNSNPDLALAASAVTKSESYVARKAPLTPVRSHQVPKGQTINAREDLKHTVTDSTKTTPAADAETSPPNSPPYSSSQDHASLSTNASTFPPSASKANRKRGVPHVYRDYSNVPDTDGFVRKKTGGVTQPFPEKLHELLERENEPTVISWLPHGRAFLVRKPKEFTNYVMPKYFRQTKLTSFQRQLNLYGFRRITQGPDGGAYYHELFLRGRPQLCMRMQRQKVKGTGHKQPADAQTEPNFYSMPSSQAQLPESSPSPTATAPPQPSSTTAQQSYEEMSPGARGVHGAAELLKNIAAGLSGSSVPFSLGVSAVSGAGDSSEQSTTAPQTTSITSRPSLQVSAPPPPPPSSASKRQLPTLLPSPPGGTGAQSMSLLGRIAQTGSTTTTFSSSSPQQSSAFFWPPSRQPVVPSLPILKESSRSAAAAAFSESETQKDRSTSHDYSSSSEVISSSYLSVGPSTTSASSPPARITFHTSPKEHNNKGKYSSSSFMPNEVASAAQTSEETTSSSSRRTIEKEDKHYHQLQGQEHNNRARKKDKRSSVRTVEYQTAADSTSSSPPSHHHLHTSLSHHNTHSSTTTTTTTTTPTNNTTTRTPDIDSSTNARVLNGIQTEEV